MSSGDYMYCYSCGAKLINGSRFCDQCGKRVMESTAPTVLPNVVEEEKVLLSRDNIRRLNKMVYQFGDLVLTTSELRFVQKGVFFGATKNIRSFPINTISRALAAKNDSVSEWKLIVYHSGGQEVYVFPEHIYKEVKVWALAIMDRFSKDCYLYDHDFYLQFINSDFAKTLKQEDEIERGHFEEHNEEVLPSLEEDDEDEVDDIETIDGQFIGDVAKSMVFSGFSPRGLRKGIKKAKNNQKKRKTQADGNKQEKTRAILQWYYDSPDYIEMKEVGNVFREAFGKETRRTKMDELVENIDRTFSREVSEARERALRKYNRTNNIVKEDDNKEEQRSIAVEKPAEAKETRISFEDQIALVEKMKELLDAGVLTQEEFDKKKKEIMQF